jgi:hypothetical protein
MPKAMRHGRHGRRRRARATVVDLSFVREERRRELAERRVRSVMDGNRAALTRLFASGLIFTQKGSRAGRDLLREHQTLQKLVDLFARLGEARDAALHNRAEEAFARLDAQLARTAQLTARAGDFVSGRSRE